MISLRSPDWQNSSALAQRGNLPDHKHAREIEVNGALFSGCLPQFYEHLQTIVIKLKTSKTNTSQNDQFEDAVKTIERKAGKKSDKDQRENLQILKKFVFNWLLKKFPRSSPHFFACLMQLNFFYQHSSSYLGDWLLDAYVSIFQSFPSLI